jgi:hypothetical protein
MFNQVHDGHFRILGTVSSTNFYKHKDAYFSYILLEQDRNTNRYIVIDSLEDAIDIRSEFTEDNKENFLFQTLSTEGKKQYLVGMLSYEDIDRIDLSFNNAIISIPLHPCRTGINEDNNDLIFSLEFIQQIPVAEIVKWLKEKDSYQYYLQK